MPLIRIASKVFGSSFRQKMLSMTALGLMAAATHAQTAAPAVSTIVAFNVSNPTGNMVKGADGALYGVAAPATPVAAGLIYRVTPDAASVETQYQIPPRTPTRRWRA